MNKPSFKFFKKTALYTILIVSSCLATSCSDEIPEESRFTFTGELISDHLENNPEYSKFVSILKKANVSKKAKSSIFKTLSTYGAYTCFAPTNDAIDEFLAEMVKDPESGIISTDVELLNDSIATEIAKNHIIEAENKTIDLKEGNIPKMTMNRRYINVSISTDATFILDNTSKIIKDIETENGVVLAIDKVINPSTKKIHEQILQHPELTLFGEAIMQTGLDSLLDIFEMDPYYENNESNIESNKYIEKEGRAFSPAERRQRYTLLIETNETFANPNLNHLGRPLLTVEDIEEFAQKFYGEEAPGDYKNPDNALNRFMRYHIIDRQLAYEGTSAGSFIMEGYTNGNFNSETNLPDKFDRYDYFETMLPYTLIKVTRPFSNPGPLKNELVINYAQENGTRCMNAVQDVDMEKHINIVVHSREESGVKDFSQTALNGMLHTIDKILVYNEDEMAGNILNERMRWDISSLFPEMTNNGIRWEENSSHKSTYIPDGYCERLVVNGVVDNTVIIYLRPSNEVTLGGYPNYQGDELLAVGRYDFKYRIPYVPEGNYEIRFGYSISTERAMTQFYYDGIVCGIPVDMTLRSDDPLIGWFDEKEMGSDEIKENDKAMRNRGYMKGPASCVLNKDGDNMRKSDLALRRIIGQFKITKGDHWLRFKNVTENEKSPNGNWVQFNQDYLEIVPVNIITNQQKPEDQN